MAITPENIAELKEHIRDLKYLAYKLGKIKLEDGEKIEDVEFTISDAIQIALESRLIDLDKNISEGKEIDASKIKALRVMGELHKSLRGERTVIKNEGTEKEEEVIKTPLQLLKENIKIEEIK